MVDHRALNEAVWQYSERIRQLDVQCDVLQVRGTSESIWMTAMLLLECARMSEKEDMTPAQIDPLTLLDAAGTLNHIAAHLRSGSAA